MTIQSRGLVWNRQPQAPLRIGKSPLTAGIGLVLLPAHNGFDYIGGKTFARVSGASIGTTQAYGGSRSYRISTSATDAFEAGVALGLGSSVTLATVVVPGTLGSTVNLFGIGNSASLTTRNRTGLRIGSTGLAEAYAIGATGTTGAAASSVAPTVGRPNVIVGLFSGTTSRRVALNGVISAAETTSATASGINTVSIGSMAGSSRLAGQVGDYLLGVAWSRVLSDAEVIAFSENPWQIFKAPQRRYFLPAGIAHTSTGALVADAATISGAAAHQHATSGALTAGAATIAGTAAHSALHTTSGALSAGSATIAGTAVHPHTATGALASQAATIAGTAAHATLHATSGALSADAASIAGTATHAVPGGAHPTDGALTAGSATIAGTATHLTLHATSGALVAQEATVAGNATHLTLHATSGALVAGSASVSGSAAGPTPVTPTQTGGFAGGWHAVIKGKRVFGRREDLIRLMQAEAIEDAREAAEEKPRAAPKPKPKKVIEEVQEVIEEQTIAFAPAAPAVVKRDETALRNMLSRIYAEAYRAEYERQAAAIRRAQDDEDEEVIFLAL